MKDDYNFDFLTLPWSYKEREFEELLVANIVKLLTELGGYFSFVGRQYHLEVDEQEYYVGLLFFHHKLRCLVAIDSKTEAFQPEFAGQMQFIRFSP